MHELGEHRSDGLDGLMSIETLCHEALYGALHRHFVSECDLVLDNDMKNRVQFFIREANTRTSVIVLRKVNTLCFIDREPFFRLAPQGDRTVAHSPFAWPLHSTELFVTHVPVTCSVTQLVIEEPVVELPRLPVRPSLSRSRRNTSSSVGIFGLRPDRSP